MSNKILSLTLVALATGNIYALTLYNSTIYNANVTARITNQDGSNEILPAEENSPAIARPGQIINLISTKPSTLNDLHADVYIYSGGSPTTLTEDAAKGMDRNYELYQPNSQVLEFYIREIN